MSDAADIAAIVTPVVVILGFIFAYRQWASYRNARMAQIILSITERWDSPLLEQSRREINTATSSGLKEAIEEADKSNSEELYPLVRVANFFDSLGLMVMEGFLDCRISYNLIGRAEEHYYEIYRPILEEAKHRDYFKYFRRLHEGFKGEAAKSSNMKPRRLP